MALHGPEDWAHIDVIGERPCSISVDLYVSSNHEAEKICQHRCSAALAQRECRECRDRVLVRVRIREAASTLREKGFI